MQEELKSLIEARLASLRDNKAELEKELNDLQIKREICIDVNLKTMKYLSDTINEINIRLDEIQTLVGEL